jgi:hypothetical protein
MPSSRITANEFYAAFQAEWTALCASEPITGLTPFESRGAWTQRIQKKDGFLYRVMKRLVNEARPLEYRTEWYFVDALYVGGENMYGDNLSYPSEVHALVEHEFDEDLETEMWKLIHWRSPLKVIITYDWADDEKTTDQRKNYLTNKASKLRSMLASVNRFHPESTDTEYLLLMASRVRHDGPITWRRVQQFTAGSTSPDGSTA